VDRNVAESQVARKGKLIKLDLLSGATDPHPRVVSATRFTRFLGLSDLSLNLMKAPVNG